MSFLSAGYTFSENEAPNAGKLHSLVDDARVHDLLPSELYTGLDYVRTTTAGSPVTGDNYLETDGLLRFFKGGAYTTLIDDPFFMALENSSGVTLERGMAVVLDQGEATPKVTKSTNANVDATVLGIVQGVVQPAATATIMVRGIMEDCVVEASGSSKAAGSFLQGPTTGRSYALVDEDPTDIPGTFGAAYFGMALDEVPDNSVSSFVTVPVYIWR